MKSLMKGSIRNSKRGPAHSWWIPLGLVVLLTACTVEENDGPVESDEFVESAPSEPGNWQFPGLVDRSGAPIEVPKPGPITGRTLDATEFGAIRIRTHKTMQQPSERLGRGRTG